MCGGSGFTPVTFATTSAQAKLTPVVSQSIDQASTSVLPISQLTGNKIFVVFAGVVGWVSGKRKFDRIVLK